MRPDYQCIGNSNRNHKLPQSKALTTKYNFEYVGTMLWYFYSKTDEKQNY